jgi:BirA family biotin operon repressor/biotin-[acetyl-CoA-carboxylase] ligase
MIAVVDVLTPCSVTLGIKWPNDLVARRQTIAGSLVKIGGIIGEHKEDCIILGLGLNIFSAPEMPERAIPPASLASLGAVNIPKPVDLAENILSAWQDLEKQRPVPFRWPEGGDAIRWEDGSGICQGWEQDGRLSVLTEKGTVLLASGEVCGVAI